MRRRYTLAAVLIAATLMISLQLPSRAGAFDYVANGGFESGADGWIASPGTTLDSVDESIVSIAEGARSGRLTVSPGSSRFEIRQPSTATLPPGVYHFDAWLRTTSGAAEAHADVAVTGTTNGIEIPAPPVANVWVELQGDIALPSFASVTIAISGRGEPGDVAYVDAVRLEGAPPATPTATVPGVEPTTEATTIAAATTAASPSPTPTDTPIPIASAAPIEAVLRNGDFELIADDGAPAGWSKYGGTLTWADAPVHSGSHAARLQSDTASTKWLYQTVLVSGGASYIFEAWVLDDHASVRSTSLRISWYASDDGSGSAIETTDSSSQLTSPSGDYRLLSTGSVIAPDGARSARLRVLLAPVSGATASILVDDASFEHAGIPASVHADAPADGGAENLVLGEARGQEPRSAESRAASASARPEPSAVVLSEVLYDPVGSDDAEWVEVYNRTNAPISLAGWSLADASGADLIQSGRVHPHGFAIIAASDSFRTAFPNYDGDLILMDGRLGNGLGNAGDRLLLRDPSGNVVDGISWGDDASVLDPAIAAVPSGHSIERRSPALDTDSAADWVDNMHPSPGAAFTPASASDNARSRPSLTQTLASSDRDLGWVPWAVLAASALGLFGVLAWRGAPLIQRLRRQA